MGEWDQSTERDCDAENECASPVQDIKVESYKVHEMYNDEFSINDILLIKLEHPVKYERSVQTICLPTNENELITKALNINKLIITGWGKTENADYSDILMYANIPYLPLDKCLEKMKEHGVKKQFDSSHICAGGVNLKDTCQGNYNQK